MLINGVTNDRGGVSHELRKHGCGGIGRGLDTSEALGRRRAEHHRGQQGRDGARGRPDLGCLGGSLDGATGLLRSALEGREDRRRGGRRRPRARRHTRRPGARGRAYQVHCHVDDDAGPEGRHRLRAELLGREGRAQAGVQHVSEDRAQGQARRVRQRHYVTCGWIWKRLIREDDLQGAATDATSQY
jgi:hypothetical protein